ncbi:MAG: hypothetical protein AB7O62_22145 [Pirellulales bacterium]
MNESWLDELKQRLASDVRDPGVDYERLQVMGMIDENGEVTGHLRRWDAFLAITAVKRAADGKRIASFRCLKPVFGMPGTATIDISRESMVDYLRQGKKIITASRDDRLDLWLEGCEIQLSAKDYIQCGSAPEGEDNVGDLPRFNLADSRL